MELATALYGYNQLNPQSKADAQDSRSQPPPYDEYVQMLNCDISISQRNSIGEPRIVVPSLSTLRAPNCQNKWSFDMTRELPTYSKAAQKGDRGGDIVSRVINEEFEWLFKRNHQEHDFGIDA